MLPLAGVNGLGFAKSGVGWLKMLKNSVRNSIFVPSVSLTRLVKFMSKTVVMGDRSVLRPRPPVRPEPARMPMYWALPGVRPIHDVVGSGLV